MPASLLPVPRAKFFGADGNPLSGGLVYTYVAGTTTPLASFTDYSGTVANTNPVTLDSRGEANIWLGNQLYKVELRTASGTTLWTVDNVGQNNVADLAAGFGIATNIASGATVDLGTIPSHFANITGTTTITSFGSSASLDAPLYLIKFNGALTLTNSGNLISPTGGNITTALNDRAWVEYLGSGAWRIIGYMRADGTALAVGSGTTNQIYATPNGSTGALTVRAMVAADMPAATTSAQGAVELATNTEAIAQSSTTLALTPSNLAGMRFTSSEISISAGGSSTVTHNLGVLYPRVEGYLVCKTGEAGYSTNDEIGPLFIGAEYGSGAGRGFTWRSTDSNNVTIRFGNSANVFDALRADTGATVGLTNGNWRFVAVVRPR